MRQFCTGFAFGSFITSGLGYAFYSHQVSENEKIKLKNEQLNKNIHSLTRDLKEETDERKRIEYLLNWTNKSIMLEQTIPTLRDIDLKSRIEINKWANTPPTLPATSDEVEKWRKSISCGCDNNVDPEDGGPLCRCTACMDLELKCKECELTTSIFYDRLLKQTIKN